MKYINILILVACAAVIPVNAQESFIYVGDIYVMPIDGYVPGWVDVETDGGNVYIYDSRRFQITVTNSFGEVLDTIELTKPGDGNGFLNDNFAIDEGIIYVQSHVFTELINGHSREMLEPSRSRIWVTNGFTIRYLHEKERVDKNKHYSFLDTGHRKIKEFGRSLLKADYLYHDNKYCRSGNGIITIASKFANSVSVYSYGGKEIRRFAIDPSALNKLTEENTGRVNAGQGMFLVIKGMNLIDNRIFVFAEPEGKGTLYEYSPSGKLLNKKVLHKGSREGSVVDVDIMKKGNEFFAYMTIVTGKEFEVLIFSLDKKGDKNEL